jgi:copper transporter 1
LYEGIKSLREYLHRVEFKKKQNDFDFETSYLKSIFCWTHLFQSCLHVLQVSVSYVLMLVVMTYNSWIFGVVSIGAGLGYFLFGRKRLSIIDLNEHCH